MKRRSALVLLAATLAAPLLTATPASADVTVCYGETVVHYGHFVILGTGNLVGGNCYPVAAPGPHVREGRTGTTYIGVFGIERVETALNTVSDLIPLR